jgi:hypothetical protein
MCIRRSARRGPSKLVLICNPNSIRVMRGNKPAWLAGAGIAFAAARLAMDDSEDESSPWSKAMNSRPATKRRVSRAAKRNTKGRRATEH